MKKIVFFISSLLFTISFQSFAQQGVSINSTGNPPDTCAILDLSSTNQGLLIPRMTSAERNAIANPKAGLMIYNTTSECFNVYKSSGGWFEICGDCVPPAPPVPSNNGPACAGDSLKLFASDITGATYSWSGPGGYSSSQQNPVIPVSYSSDEGIYSVRATINGCNTQYATTNVIVDTIPVQPGSISGTSCVGSGSSGNVYSISTVTGATTYTWTVPSGSTVTSGQGTTSATITFGSTSGDVCVEAENYCGTSAQSCKAISLTCSNLTNWQYKMPITINNSGFGSSITNYQINVIINTQALVNDNKMESDGSDIRFTDSDSCTLLHYWIEKGMNTTSTSIWIKVPLIPASSTKKIFLFYGNNGATATANGDSTFMFYDDFEGISNGNPPNPSKWSITAGTTIQSGKMRLVEYAKILNPIGTNHIMEGSMAATSPGGNHDFRIDVLLTALGTCAAANNYLQYLLPWEGGDSRTDNFNTSCGAISNICSGAPKYTNYEFRVTTYVSGGTSYLNAYNVSTSSTILNCSSTWKTTGDYIQLLAVSSSGRYADVDNFRIRKYSSYVPPISYGSESGLCP